MLNDYMLTRYSIRKRTCLDVAVVATTMLGLNVCAAPTPTVDRPNVLFIAVDDLRTTIGCYSDEQALTPRLDEFAKTGCVFKRAYCAVPTCGASRASLLTGLRPRPDRFLSARTRCDGPMFEKHRRYLTGKLEKGAPGITTLPAWFKQHGYHTVGYGKIFDNSSDGNQCWSENNGATWKPKCPHLKGGDWRKWDKQNPQADLPDSMFLDGFLADNAITKLAELKKPGQPFFFGVGFGKPHTPFVAPKKYWDLYNPDKLVLTDYPYPPRNCPKLAYSHSARKAFEEGRLHPGEETIRKFVHGYLACTSFVDAQIGRVLDGLKANGLIDNTVVVIWGDHGLGNGEHAHFAKHCCFESILHSPLLVRMPDVKGGVSTQALTEFVDIYPSLCEATGIPLPDHLQGRSFVPLLSKPDQPWKEAAFSRYPSLPEGHGHSVKTDRYRYTRWKNAGGKQVGHMLFDHKTDPDENTNIADNPENAEIIARMNKLLDSDEKAAQEVVSKVVLK